MSGGLGVSSAPPDSAWGEFDFAGVSASPAAFRGAAAASSSGSMRKSTAGGGSWEDMRKEARMLENQIDAKLVSYSKLGTNFGSGGGSSLSAAPASSSDKAPLLSSESSTASSSPKEVFSVMSNEIGGLLARLAAVNEGMADYASRQPQSAAIHHTLQRHRDILQDYRQEFTKTKKNIEGVIEREDLLSSVQREINDYGKSSSASGSNKRMDLLLKESESARNSERMIDDQISIAIEARDALAAQRATFKAIRTKLNDISNRFPVINSLVQKINLRKRRDTVIIGLVVGLCFTFLLWYAFG